MRAALRARDAAEPALRAALRARDAAEPALRAALRARDAAEPALRSALRARDAAEPALRAALRARDAAEPALRAALRARDAAEPALRAGLRARLGVRPCWNIPMFRPTKGRLEIGSVPPDLTGSASVWNIVGFRTTKDTSDSARSGMLSRRLEHREVPSAVGGRVEPPATDDVLGLDESPRHSGTNQCRLGPCH